MPLACDRVMAHYNCEVKAVLGQALISLKSSEERDNIVGICIITEVSLSPAAPADSPSRHLVHVSAVLASGFASLGLTPFSWHGAD